MRRGSGMPLVVVHGNGVDLRLLLPLDECFADDAWERIYLDLPRFGRTPSLPGIGGLLARHVAARLGHQVAGLALIAPVVDPDPTRRTLPGLCVVERDDALLASLDADDKEEFAGVAARQTATSWEAFRNYALPGIRVATRRSCPSSQLGASSTLSQRQRQCLSRDRQ